MSQSKAIKAGTMCLVSIDLLDVILPQKDALTLVELMSRAKRCRTIYPGYQLDADELEVRLAVIKSHDKIYGPGEKQA